MPRSQLTAASMSAEQSCERQVTEAATGQAREARGSVRQPDSPYYKGGRGFEASGACTASEIARPPTTGQAGSRRPILTDGGYRYIFDTGHYRPE